MVWAGCVADWKMKDVHLPNLRSSAHVLHLKPELVYRPRWGGIGWWLSRSFKLPKVGRHPCRILMMSYLVLVDAQRQSKVQLCHKLLKYWGDQCVAQFYRFFIAWRLCSTMWVVRTSTFVPWRWGCGSQLFGFSWPKPTWSIARSWVCWKDPDSSEELGNRKQQSALLS